MKMCHYGMNVISLIHLLNGSFLPDATIALNYMLNRFGNIVKNLTVYPENMKRNMDRTLGLIYSQRVLLALSIKDLSVKKLMIQFSRKRWKHGRIRFHSAA